MDLAEAYVKFCIQYLFENHTEELEYFEAEQVRRAKEEKKPEVDVKLRDNLKNVMDSEFIRITYEEAIKICMEVSILIQAFLCGSNDDFSTIKKERLTLKLNWNGALI